LPILLFREGPSSLPSRSQEDTSNNETVAGGNTQRASKLGFMVGLLLEAAHSAQPTSTSASASFSMRTSSKVQISSENSGPGPNGTQRARDGFPASQSKRWSTISRSSRTPPWTSAS